MAKVLMTKHFGALRPADSVAEAALSRIKNADTVLVEFRRPRNLSHHKMFWALMGLVHDNLDHDRYPTVEDFVAAVKIAAGLRTRIELPNGDVGFIPGSIAFHKMDQDEFSKFYDRVCDLIAKHFLPGVNTDDLRREVEIMIGVAA